MLDCAEATNSVFSRLYSNHTKQLKTSGEGGWQSGCKKTKLFNTVLCAKPCDYRVTEKASTFSRPSPYVLAPRPGLEPGTYGLTVRGFKPRLE